MVQVSLHLADALQAGRPGLQQPAVADRPPEAQLSSPVYTPRSTLWTPPAAKRDPLAEARATAAASRGPVTGRSLGDRLETEQAGAPADGGRPVQQAEEWEAPAGANPWQHEQPLYPLHHQFVLREALATDRSAGVCWCHQAALLHCATASAHIIVAAPGGCWHDRTPGVAEGCTEHAGCATLSTLCCHHCT